MEEDVEPKDEDGVDGRGVGGWDGWVCGLGTVGSSPIFGLVRRTGVFVSVFPTFVLYQECSSRNSTVTMTTSSDQCLLHDMREWSVVPCRGIRMSVSTWVSVGRPSSLGHTFVHRIRVMGGCVIW